MIYFTADHHFGHANIIKFCKRPFNNIQEMDTVLIRKWNERVKPVDTVFYIGDFAYRIKKRVDYYISQLNGNIIFIKGNHDKNNGLKTCIHHILIKYGGMKINLVHHPMYADYLCDLNFCGHVHEKWKFKKMYITGFGDFYVINVGVDVWGFYPITFNEIISKFSYWKKRG